MGLCGDDYTLPGPLKSEEGAGWEPTVNRGRVDVLEHPWRRG